VDIIARTYRWLALRFDLHMSVLHVPSFAGGAVLAGSSDAQASNEVQQADNVDIGSRGQLTTTGGISTYGVQLNDSETSPQPVTQIYGIGVGSYAQSTTAFAVSGGLDSSSVARYLTHQFAPGFTTGSIDSALGLVGPVSPPRSVNGAIVTFASFPYVDTLGIQRRPLFFNIGSRSMDQPRTAPGLYVASYQGGFGIVSGFTLVGGYTYTYQATLVLFPTAVVEDSLRALVIETSIAAVEAQAGSYYYASGILYVHASTGIPTGHVYTYPNGSTNYIQAPISVYDALGTGNDGQYPGGTDAVQLYFRGIAGYNNTLFGWGFDNSDPMYGDGPARLMFSAVGNPYMWGNDNQAAVGTNRPFSDTDGITVGSAGEVITSCLASHGKLYIATNRGLHYLSGYGRDSWTTDGTTGVAQSLDVIGANAMIEGPDGLLYGVSSRGLWRLNTISYFTVPVEHLYRKLIKFDGTSPGYWDLIATTPTASPGYPGTTNSDLVWMYSDVQNMQVCIVIPFANLNGSGQGTVIIKYHTESGGFTRQLISPNNISFTAGAPFKRTATSAAVTVFGDSGSGNGTTVRQYPPLNPASTATGGAITFGEYAPFGPDGEGVCRVCYLVLSWVTDALPITGTITPSVDQRVFPTVNLTISPTVPATPADGDLWVDTSGTDPNLGNATSGTIVVALNDYLVKLWKASWNQWVILPRSGGAKGSRNGIPIAFTAQRGTRVKIALSLSAADKVQVEGLGLEPALIRAAA
jgi:hypothetical protein